MIDFIKKLIPKASIYKLLGAQKGIHQLVNNFYQVMETHPQAKDCLKVHELCDNKKVTALTKLKFEEFLSGWLGGPKLFVEKYGHPRMRMRHGHIKITPLEAEQWLYCMYQALELHPKKLNEKTKNQVFNSCKALTMRIINSQ